MTQTIITTAFSEYKAEKEAAVETVELDEFVLAYVPELDPDAVIDSSEGLPDDEHIVYTSAVTQSGYVNSNAVVYSITMDTSVGDFDFNWIGLRNAESGVIAAISHLPDITKTASISGTQDGNSITRSIMMSYSGAQSITGINVDASTWQIDFTARLLGIDETERLANIDHYGDASFLSDGFKVYQEDDDYKLTDGTGYVGGLRCITADEQVISDVVVSSSIYLDASWQGQLTSKWSSLTTITSSTEVLIDYVDDDGYQHYVTKIAEIDADGNITDTRTTGGTSSFERVDNAATDDDITNESTEEKHVKLTQFWKGIVNKITTAFANRTISTTSPLSGGGDLSGDLTLEIDLATLVPVGAPLPWPKNTAPDDYAIMKGQSFDTEMYPELALIYTDGVIPDMRGMAVVGKSDSDTVLAYEADAVKSHNHTGAVSTKDIGTKTTSTNSHSHYFTKGSASDINTGSNILSVDDYCGGTQYTQWTNSVSHSHSVTVGSHNHTVSIASTGNSENTIKNRKFNWIVRVA